VTDEPWRFWYSGPPNRLEFGATCNRCVGKLTAVKGRDGEERSRLMREHDRQAHSPVDPVLLVERALRLRQFGDRPGVDSWAAWERDADLYVRKHDP
jgi:hypothetical protein